MKWTWISVLLASIAFAGFVVSEVVLWETGVVLPIWFIKGLSATFGLIFAGSVYYPTRLFVESFSRQNNDER